MLHAIALRQPENTQSSSYFRDPFVVTIYQSPPGWCLYAYPLLSLKHSHNFRHTYLLRESTISISRIVGFTTQLIHCINSSELNLQCGDYTHQRGRHNYFIFLFQKREGSLSKLIHNIFVDRMPAEYSTRGSLPDESRNTRQGHGGIGI